MDNFLYNFKIDNILNVMVDSNNIILIEIRLEY